MDQAGLPKYEHTGNMTGPNYCMDVVGSTIVVAGNPVTYINLQTVAATGMSY